MRFPARFAAVGALLSVALLLLASPARAQAPINLTDGNATYSQSTGPLNVNSAGPTATLRPEGTTDHLDQNWWWYRVAGDNRERPFGTWTDGTIVMTAGQSTTTNSATTTFSESRSASANFTATYTATLIDGGSPGSARVVQSFVINNPTATQLDISLFNYVDFDLDAITGPSTATQISPGLIQNVHGSTRGLMQGDSPTHYQVANYSALLTSLSDAPVSPTFNAVTDLNDTGLPFSTGDFTGAYQWNFSIAPGGSVTVNGYLEIVPEPGPIALLSAAAIGLAGWTWRRRRRNRQITAEPPGVST